MKDVLLQGGPGVLDMKDVVVKGMIHMKEDLV